MADTSLVKKPRFDHPLPVFVLVTLTLALLAMSITFKVLDSRTVANPCDEQLGRFRMHIAQTNPPSVFDTAAWEALTNRYNGLFDVCDSTVAAAFTAEEFDPWAKPALAPFETQDKPADSTTPSTTAPNTK